MTLFLGTFSHKCRKIVKNRPKRGPKRGKKSKKKVCFVLLSSVRNLGFWGENNALIRFTTKMAKRATPPLSQAQTGIFRKRGQKPPFFALFCPKSGILATTADDRKKPKKTLFLAKIGQNPTAFFTSSLQEMENDFIKSFLPFAILSLKIIKFIR